MVTFHSSSCIRHRAAGMLSRTIQRRPYDGMPTKVGRKSIAYVDLGAVLSHLSRSWQLVQRSVAAFVWAYPPHDAVTCGKPTVNSKRIQVTFFYIS